MKRLHIHVSVADLQNSIEFYSTLFATEPTVVQADYAKWMLDDPRMNFAISQRGAKVGLDHLGIQVENADELSEMQQRLNLLSTELVEQSGTACCYAQSDKYWMKDPSGMPWETFHTLDRVPVFGKETQSVDACTSGSSCCVPVIPEPKPAASQACCGANGSGCC